MYITHTQYKIFLYFSSVVLGLCIFGSTIVYAQSIESQIENRKQQLEEELKNVEKEIEALKPLKEEKAVERTSLENDIAVINYKISKARASIDARVNTIQNINKDISVRSESIQELEAKYEREKSSLAQLLRRTHEIDNTTLAEMILGTDTLSNFFEDLDSFSTLKRALDTSFEVISADKAHLSNEQNVLLEERIEEEDLRRVQELEKAAIERREAEKQEILAVTKGQEAAYQTLIKKRERSAAEIRAELFNLRGSTAIPFGEALSYATDVSEKTGVRAAVILAILTQESNLGENVGQCILKNPDTGSGIGKNTGRFFETIMKPTRDVAPFLEVTAKLGFDPYSIPVSCPPSYGYGGAMGPAQFIPSTWVLYEKRIGKASGEVPPNPWNARTAFFATGLLMMDNGADKGTWSDERLAALRYFAGWRNASKSAYAFYGDDVMELAEKYQKQIDILSGA